MRRRLLLLLLLGTVYDSRTPRAVGQEIPVQQQKKIQLLARAPVSQGTIQLGVAEVLTLVVAIDGSFQGEVQPPKVLTRTPGWREWRRSSPKVSTYILELAPLAPGDYSLQLEPWKMRGSYQAWQIIAWKPLAVRVLGTLKEADPKSLRDITAIENVPEVPPSEPWPWEWIGVGLAGVVIVTGGCLMLVRRGAAVRSTVSAERWALQRLERLARLPLAGPERLVAAHGLLATLVRSYLARRWQIPARRRTTSELAEDLQKTTAIPVEDRVWIQQLLNQCDQVRFARRPVTEEEWRTLVGQTRQYLQPRQT